MMLKLTSSFKSRGTKTPEGKEGKLGWRSVRGDMRKHLVGNRAADVWDKLNEEEVNVDASGKLTSLYKKKRDVERWRHTRVKLPSNILYTLGYTRT